MKKPDEVFLGIRSELDTKKRLEVVAEVLGVSFAEAHRRTIDVGLDVFDLFNKAGIFKVRGLVGELSQSFLMRKKKSV